MEAATPLRRAQVRTLGGRVAVDGLVVSDPGVVALVQGREESGEDPAKAVSDALEIGARVLDREQTGASTEFVRTEFEKVSREVEHAFTERARGVAEQLGSKVDEAFGPESGHVTKALQRHFSDDSAGAVQHRVRAAVQEMMGAAREDLLRQFSSADGRNPLADFKTQSIGAIRDASRRQEINLTAMLEKMAGLERELQGLRDERAKREEVEAERDKGTAKGRTYEEGVHEALDAVARAQGDDCDAVGDLKGAGRRTGDVVVALEACAGPARGRIVFEAKDRRLSKPEALAELDRALTVRDADFAVLVVPGEEKVPAKLVPLREYNGDKLVVTFNPEDDSRLPLEVAYALARARVLMARGGGDEIDPDAMRAVIERALGALDDARKVKTQLSNATTSIETARAVLETMGARVREHLEELTGLLTGGATAER